jgi:glycosyltransferase involved in cell wall biosynthesis
MLNNREEAHEMGRNAIKDVQRRFSIDVLLQKNIDMYERVIKL